MTDSLSDKEKSHPFVLTRTSHQDIRYNSEINPVTRNWQELAYERLDIIYGVSKLLSFFESLESTFPKIMTLCATTIPISTAVLIEKRGQKIATALWHAEGASPEQIEHAIDNANKAFMYLTGVEVSEFAPKASVLENGVPAGNLGYVALPLVVDKLPAHGVFQLDGASLLNEKDLKFASSLAEFLAVAVDRDHKKQVQMEWQARESAKVASKLSDVQGQVSDLETERGLRESFVSLLSHDLRTPLAAIKMSAQLISYQAGVSEDIKSLANRINSNAVRADQMVSDLLDANRIRSGEKLPLQYEAFEMRALIRQTLEELSMVHGDRFLLQGGDDILGYWDRRGIRRIIENLCNNGIKYGSEHTPVSLFLSHVGDSVVIKVQNWGDLISQEDQESLFQQYRRGRKADGGRNKGWGIGLTLVRGVTEAHGGSVKLESEVESGTVFSVQLPIDSRIQAKEEA